MICEFKMGLKSTCGRGAGGCFPTLMSAEMLISGGVRVMDGHCWGPSPMLIQDRADSPWAHSFWTVQLEDVTDSTPHLSTFGLKKKDRNKQRTDKDI